MDARVEMLWLVLAKDPKLYYTSQNATVSPNQKDQQMMLKKKSV